MRIDAGISGQYTGQRSQTAPSRNPSAPTFAAALTESQADATKAANPDRSSAASLGGAVSAASAQASAPAVQTVTAKDGTVWTVTNIAASLTDDDKRVLGWPTTDPATGMLAAMVAQDRNQGVLSGPMTTDYIMGNRAKGIAGLVNREPDSVMTPARVNAMLGRLDQTAPDFTNMTRQDMRGWVNNQIRSGQMSLDDSRPFMAMTMKIPVGGNDELPADSDNVRYDFTQKVRAGIEAALTRNDTATLQMLQSASRTMEQG